MRKKGIVIQEIVLWILAIGVIMTVAFITPKWLQAQDDERQDILCQFTTSLQDQFKTAQLTPVSEKCARKFVSFHNDHAEVSTIETTNNVEFTILREDGTKYLSETYPELTETVFYGVVANEMLDCWNKFGSGEKNVFQGTLGHDHNRICAVCSQISIRADRNPTPSESGNLRAYLGRQELVDDLTVHQELFLPTDRGWVEFLLSDVGEMLLSKVLDEEQYDDGQIPSLQTFDGIIDKDKNYLVVFSQFKPGALQEATLDDRLSFIIFGTRQRRLVTLKLDLSNYLHSVGPTASKRAAFWRGHFLGR